MPSDESTCRLNRLINSSSPYLLQHARNPVDWYPWGPEALERARRENKPILLSIGYSACHWCHVMERECFEDEEVARLMNEGFVCIKVDREERPDVDEVYMRAVQALTGSGGWPLNVFLTPELKPFFGGTYWPPRDRGQLAGFPRVLRSVRDAFQDRRDEINKSAAQIVDAIRQSMAPPKEPGTLSEALLEAALKSLAADFDLRDTGFGDGPKFPQAPVLDWALRLWGCTGNDRPRFMLVHTLESMVRGGLCDQLGGGFHRYTVDAQWRIPHFEKMLYDNAQLVGVCADAARALGNHEFLNAATDAADYLLREMRSPNGAFYSAQDADSEGVEGRYYAWTYQEIMDCLGTYDGAIVARYFDATQDGNWENGLNVLRRPRPLAALAEEFHLAEADAAELIQRGRRTMLLRRRRRVPPQTDTKVLTDWNALAVSGLVRLHRATREDAYLDAARACAAFLLERLRPEGCLMHSWHQGKAQVPGFLSDHVCLATALLDLYETGFDPSYLREAARLAATVMAEFWDPADGAFHDVGPRGEQLIATVRAATDQPLPAGSSVACDLLLRLGDLLDNKDYVHAAERLLERHARAMQEQAGSHGAMLSAALRYLLKPREFVIVGVGLDEAAELVEALDEFYLPNMVRAGAAADLAGTDARTLTEEVPLLKGKLPALGGAVAYVCSAGACREPAQEPDALRAQLRALLPKT
jgi:hypothetical protein